MFSAAVGGVLVRVGRGVVRCGVFVGRMRVAVTVRVGVVDGVAVGVVVAVSVGEIVSVGVEVAVEVDSGV